MSRILNLLPDYIDIDDEEAIESYMYKLELQELIDKGEFLDNSLLREFLEDILPYKGPNHFIMVSDKEGRTKNLAYSREECINALSGTRQLLIYSASQKKIMREAIAITPKHNEKQEKKSRIKSTMPIEKKKQAKHLLS